MDIQYVGYMDDYLHVDKYCWLAKRMMLLQAYPFEDMDIQRHGLLIHIMMMTSYFIMIGLVFTYVDAYQMWDTWMITCMLINIVGWPRE